MNALFLRVLLGLLAFGSCITAGPVATPSLKPLSLRTNTTDNSAGLFCGIFNTANTQDTDDNISWLKNNVGTCFTPAQTCRRHSCINTSGVYVCNDNNHDITLSCANDVVPRLDDVIVHCCNGAKSGISGQKFSDDGTWNAIIAYGNCNHNWDADRPSMGPPDDIWGPNGACNKIAVTGVGSGVP
ncbi:hypothetical protein B0T26DRAFT_747297 [Lasiosphaeria miniovina]|uniref:Ig-like domain-containing protein n=1 Tax=Lasiosphaeria miniovina TaxID=1954250 RepID=A0AA40E3P9_9PEZI|nr:uncharacterized protein B0T26DRAFT_747297 [Lasiosphaeria miniovina]KAK0726904.1 hypothetical protein B0T26DRAFT_747297 [Lasiosphaeria miniovina]